MIGSANVDAILVGATPITGKIIDAAPVLKVVSRRGVGYDNIDLAALRRRKIPLTIVGSANASTVAEHTLCFMLALAKQAIALRSGDKGWQLAISRKPASGGSGWEDIVVSRLWPRRPRCRRSCASLLVCA